MMRRIVTSLGRTAFRSRNFKALRMAASDEPAGFGANTGQNIHGLRPTAEKKNWTADAKDQFHDFKKDAKFEKKDTKLEDSKIEKKDPYQADTLRASGEGMTENKAETFDKTANLNKPNINKAAKNTAGNGPHDTFKPWEAQSKVSTPFHSNINAADTTDMNKPTGQKGPGAFQSGSHMADNMRTTGSTNQWQSKHAHNEQCGYGEKCAPNTASQYDKSTNQYESKNMGAKTCATDSAACHMESGKCTTHSSQQTGQTGTSFGAGSQTTQKVDQGMVDKAMNWVKEKFGGATSESTSNQQNMQDIQQKNRATADSDKAFKDKKEFRQDQH